MIAAQRAEYDLRKARIGEQMMAFVRPHASHYVMRSQYEAVGMIVDGCQDLVRVGGAWVPSFVGGTSIESACAVAWAIRMLTGQGVCFRFNGVAVAFGEGGDA